jgi:hypothetical protein
MAGARARYYETPAVEVAFWLGSLGYVPSVSEIRLRTGCSRATAYRWKAFAEGYGRGHLSPLKERKHA